MNKPNFYLNTAYGDATYYYVQFADMYFPLQKC